MKNTTEIDQDRLKEAIHQVKILSAYVPVTVIAYTEYVGKFLESLVNEPNPDGLDDLKVGDVLQHKDPDVRRMVLAIDASENEDEPHFYVAGYGEIIFFTKQELRDCVYRKATE